MGSYSPAIAQAIGFLLILEALRRSGVDVSQYQNINEIPTRSMDRKLPIARVDSQGNSICIPRALLARGGIEPNPGPPG